MSNYIFMISFVFNYETISIYYIRTYAVELNNQQLQTFNYINLNLTAMFIALAFEPQVPKYYVMNFLLSYYYGLGPQRQRPSLHIGWIPFLQTGFGCGHQGIHFQSPCIQNGFSPGGQIGGLDKHGIGSYSMI
jgi:hypothetical protein